MTTDLFSEDDLASSEIENRSATEYASKAYLEYAMSVVKGRAIPFTQDGLKPVQRRVIYALSLLNGQNGALFKSARVVGDVIGKYHPHGDQSVYDAMVRTAQPFTFRYPIIDGQGNFGSREGDNAAAMRYTEVRLSKYAEIYLDELDKGTVPWMPNYDGAFKEPKIMPARLPMLLANGSEGIGVGMACSIPSHNIRELAAASVALIKNPNIELDEILTHITGPDLPCGSQIISSYDTIKKAYETGNASLKARAVYHFEELSRGQWQLVVDEIPPEGSVSKVIEQIEDCLNPKIKKDKKSLEPEQLMLKQLALSLVDAVRDESDKEHNLRLVITPTTSKVDRDALLALLFKHTDLESGIPFNMVAVCADGAPRSLNLIGMLQEWVDHRFICITNRTKYRLEEVLARIHILEGRHIVFLNIDEVIRIIRESDEPKAALIERFNLSDIQAEDILEIRLRQLARLEGIKIEQELDKLRKEEKHLKALLSDTEKMKALMIEEIEADAVKYGDDRRTLIKEADSIELSKAAVKVADEPLSIIISQRGWVRSRQGHEIDRGALTFKEGDSFGSVIACRSVDSVIVIDDGGRVYNILAGTIPGGRGDGVPLTTLIELQSGSKIAHVFAGKLTDKVLLGADNSYGFVCEIGNMIAKNKSGKQFMTVKDGAKIMPPVIIGEPIDDKLLVSVGSGGKLLAYPLSEMKVLNAGGQGVTIMNIGDDEKLVVLTVVHKDSSVNVIGLSGKKEVSSKIDFTKDDKFIVGRAKKGCLIPVKMIPTSVNVIG